MTLVYFLIGVIITVTSISLIMYYSWIRHTDVAVIKYSEFKALYDIAPDKWRKKYEYTLGYDIGNSEEKCVRISSPVGYVRALLDINHRYNQKLHKEAIENKEILTKYWKADIEEYKQRAYNDLKKQIENNSIAIFSKDQEDIIKKVVREVCLGNGCSEEAARKAADEAATTIEIKAVGTCYD